VGHNQHVVAAADGETFVGLYWLDLQPKEQSHHVVAAASFKVSVTRIWWLCQQPKGTYTYQTFIIALATAALLALLVHRLRFSGATEQGQE
jgi:hypothetical protein